MSARLFKKGDRVVWARSQFPERIGRTGTVVRLIFDGVFLRVKLDRPDDYTGETESEWAASCFDILEDASELICEDWS